jgi:hypothetical protein
MFKRKLEIVGIIHDQIRGAVAGAEIVVASPMRLPVAPTATAASAKTAKSKSRISTENGQHKYVAPWRQAQPCASPNAAAIRNQGRPTP